MGTRSARLLLPALCVTLLAAGCGSKDSGPDPAPAADGLAQGLTSGDLSGVVFSGMDASQADREYDATVAGLGGVKPKVEVTAVKKSSGARRRPRR